MTLAYFDCFAGSGGDMIVASLIDAGAGIDAIRDELAKLGLAGMSVDVQRVHRAGLGAMHFQVTTPHDHEHDADHHHAHRSLGAILELIDNARLPARAADRARRIFQRLANAEAKVHDIAIEQVHFHEVGAVDSIVDIVAACVAMELLDVERVLCSPIPVGSGTVKCEHGVLPVPAPATAQLLIGAPTRPSDAVFEQTTPTAAAVLTTLAEGFGPLPAMHISAVGCGAGTRDEGPLPNILRVFVGTQDVEGEADTVVELSANVDDCTGEVIGATIDRLLSAGCLDAWAAPIVMKKSRPAWTLSVLCRPHDAREAERILFAETTTFGVRRSELARAKLQRHWETVETPYGPIRIKVGRRGGKELTAGAEFDDARQAAERHNVSVREVLTAAQTIYRNRPGRGD